jgi:hypothetical protein
MASTGRWATTMRRVPAECAWGGCGRPAGVDVLVTVPGEPPRLAVRVGSYCVGHAVIVGSGCGQSCWVGMIHSSRMAVWRGRVTM